MLAKRTLVVIILLPLGLAAIFAGTVIYTTLIVLIIGLAAWEYERLFCAAGYQPTRFLITGGAMLLVIARAVDGFKSAPAIISLLLLGSMVYHLFSYEKGNERAATDFNITITGMLYLGWIGAYMVSIYTLPDGKWWTLLVLPAVWLADTGAYLIGKNIGRHKMTQRLSPKKSWEGYLGGILTGTLGGVFLVYLWRLFGASPLIAPWHGAVLGFVLAALSLLGDLGESMIKRQVKVKDSSNLLPGHGGVLDRIDSWLWGGVLGYYIIVGFFLR